MSRSEIRGPSATMDSSSFFNKGFAFRDERQFASWESEGMNNLYGRKSDFASSPYITSPYGLRGNSLIANGFKHSDFDLNRDQRVDALVGTYTPRLEKASNFDMLRGSRQNLGSAGYFTDNISLFPSVRIDGPHEEEESSESLKELEAKTIGNLLPDDDDDLFYGVTNATFSKNGPTGRDEMVADFLTYVGELKIGEDGQKKPEALEGNHPLSEYPSRTLFVRNIDSSIQDAELQALFGQYGDISSLYTTCKRRGFVMISYYDIRAACNAMRALQDKPMQHKKLDIHFSVPKENPSEKEAHLGTLVVSNLESSLSSDELHQIFGLYGEVKEIRETPHRGPHKFVEFYDVRAANAALHAMNRSDIAKKMIKVELLHLGGITSNLDAGTVLSTRSSSRPPMSPYRESVFHNRSPSLPNLESINHHSGSMEGSNPRGQSKFEIWGTQNFHSPSRPDYQSSFANGDVCISPGNGNCLSPGQQQMWRSSPGSQPQGMMWLNSPSLINGVSSPRLQQMYATGTPPSHLPIGLVQMNNHPMGSSPSGNPSLWERRHNCSPKSQDIPTFNSGSPGGLNMPGNFQLHPQNQQFVMVPTRGQLSPSLSPFTSPTERARGRKNDRTSNQGDKQFELDVDRIMKGEDKRTTLMIKNIPNKYTSKMLLAALDEHHKGTYDFLYLPIDFKNKCNVGYSFINMIEPSLIVPLYQALNGKKWEKFNSEKVASLTYARIQGKAALVSHFQHSSLMNEDKRCRPILFHSDGPNAGKQVPFPVGETIRSRPRTPSSSSSENIQEGLHGSVTGEEFSSGNSGSEITHARVSD